MTASLGAFLALIEENSVAYRNLMSSATSAPQIRGLIDQVRRQTAARILAGIYPDDPPPKARAAVSGWLWFMDGACLDWLEHRDIDRDELRDLLLGTLMGALVASGSPPDSAPEGIRVTGDIKFVAHLSSLSKLSVTMPLAKAIGATPTLRFP